jgi:hypothetical protein
MDPDPGDKSEDIAKVSLLLPLLEWYMTVRTVLDTILLMLWTFPQTYLLMYS